MKNIKNALFFISSLIFSMFFSSCDGVLFDEITYVDYPVYTVHPTPPHHRPIPFHKEYPRRFEPIRERPHNNFQPRVQRGGPRGASQPGRGFNRC